MATPTAPPVDIRDPEQLPGVSRTTAIDLVTRMRDLYADMETRLATDIGRQLAAGIDSPSWAADKREQAARLRRHTQSLLAQLEKDTSREVTYAIISAYMRGGQEATKALTQLGLGFPANPDAKLQKALDGPQSQLTAALTEIGRAFPAVAAMMRVAGSLALRITGTHLPVLRWAEDAYRQVVAAGALSDVLGGIATRRRASQVAWERLLGDGITGFTDRAGKHWNLATYVEMATRTGVAQAAVEGHLDRLEEGGLDLVVGSNAPQECERCRPWEGKILARKGPPGRRTVQVENVLTGEMEPIEIAGTVDEAIAAGWMHPNCRHRFVAYLHGATKIPRDTADPEGDAARQQLRALERKVRREKLLAVSAIDPAAKKTHEANARGWQEKIRGHVDANEHLGIFRKREREQINLGNGPTAIGPGKPRPAPKPTPTPPKPAPTPAPPVAPPPPKAEPKRQPPKPPAPAAPSNEFGDDFAVRPMTQREVEIRDLELKLLTAKQDAITYAKSWQDSIDRERAKPNPDHEQIQYFKARIVASKRLPETLREKLADVRTRKDPALEEPARGGFMARSGTPSQARAQAHLRTVMHDSVAGPERQALLTELDRQASLSTRSVMRLKRVTFPVSPDDIDYLRDPAKASVLAFYRWDLYSITMSGKWLSDREGFDYTCQHAQRSGWWTPTGAADHMATTCAHEYGHHIDNMIFGKGFGSLSNNERGRPLLAAIAEVLGVRVDAATLQVRAELDRIVSDNKALLAHRVSQYGTTNASEFLAEIWQEYSTMGVKARPWIRKIGQVMNELADKGALE